MAGILDDLVIGFVGAGAIAEAMLRGLAGAGPRLIASDPDPDRRARVAEIGVSTLADNRAVVAEAQLVVLAVKPQVAPAVLAEIGPVMRPGQVLLSIVAGLPREAIAGFLPGGVEIIRAMPNAPALIGAGITGVSVGGGRNHEDLAWAILSTLGRVVFVPERMLDAVTGLSGSGPAYVALFTEALIEAGVKVGLARPVAAELAVQTLLGSARLLAAGEAPAALRERVTSPGGTTACGLYALERGGVRAAIIEAVTVATERSAELGAIAGAGSERS